MIFIIQNTHAVNISFLGAHLHLSLAVALLLAAIAGALLMAAAGTARITQLRRIMRSDRRNPAGQLKQPSYRARQCPGTRGGRNRQSPLPTAARPPTPATGYRAPDVRH